MNLQTNIPLSKQSNNLIDYKSNMLLLGSCFVENIGEKLDYFKFRTSINPFGILFHPIAIEKLITKAIHKGSYTEEDVFYHNECWHCYDAHSSLSSVSREKLLDSLNNTRDETHQQIIKSTHIVITLGTAWVYRFIESDAIVANCHKVPQKKFLKELLSIDEITQSLNRIIKLIKKVNHNVSIIFTVSPVRHLKDGFIENTRSKSHLISAVHNTLNQKPEINNHQLCYFPSYELMMDELRDYRFYTEDMIHPSQLAIDYIWERFIYVWVSEHATQLMEQVEHIQKGLAHKPFNPESEQHQKFLMSLSKKKEQLKQKLPHLQFNEV